MMIIKNYHKFLPWFVSIFLGNIDGLRFEEKLLRFGALLCFLFSGLSMVTNLFVQQDFWMSFWGNISTILYLVVYIISRRKHSYNFLYYSLLIMTLFSVFLAWKSFDGFAGPALLILIMLSLFYSLLTKGIHSIIVLFSCIGFTIILGVYEFWHPEAVLPYKDNASRLTDLIFSASLAILFSFVIVKVVFNRYLERERVLQENLVLEEKNRYITENMIHLRDINSQKDKFFSIVSHDLRAPFSGFLGLSDILRTEADTLSKEEIKELSVAMHTSATSIYTLLDELLQWSMSQMGKIAFKPQQLKLSELIDNTVFFLKKEAEKKSIQMKIEVENEITFTGDMNMIISLIRNLVINAIKFSYPGGKIKIVSQSNQNQLEVSVSDYGIGIPASRINQLFEIDTPSSTLGTSGEHGTGLGLILCKDFVEKHGGKIRAESEEGKGSTFTFSLPIKPTV